MKPKKLTKEEIKANAEKFAAAYRIHKERCQILKEGSRERGEPWFSYPTFNPPQSKRFLPGLPCLVTIRKSGKAYRPMGSSIPFIGSDGREFLCAVQDRNGKPYGPIRNINVDNTDLMEE